MNLLGIVIVAGIIVVVGIAAVIAAVLISNRK